MWGTGHFVEGARLLDAPLWDLKLHGKSSVHVGMEVSQANDSSVQLAQGSLTQALKPIPTLTALWAARQYIL